MASVGRAASTDLPIILEDQYRLAHRRQSGWPDPGRRAVPATQPLFPDLRLTQFLCPAVEPNDLAASLQDLVRGVVQQPVFLRCSRPIEGRKRSRAEELSDGAAEVAFQSLPRRAPYSRTYLDLAENLATHFGPSPNEVDCASTLVVEPILDDDPGPTSGRMAVKRDQEPGSAFQ